MSSMFWGLSMKPNRKYTQTIVKSFHISGAAIDEGEAAKLYVTADKTKFTVATLNKSVPQFALDLNFCKGDKIMFQTTGDATVSLIGYLHAAEEESDDDDYEEDEYAAIAKQLNVEKARVKAKNDSESEEASGSEEEEDDEDADDSKLTAEYESFVGDESGEDDEDESDEEEDDDDDDDDSEEEEDESPAAKKPKINETAKKPTKNQNGVAKNEQKEQQQQQQQPKSKKDKKGAAAAEVQKAQPKGKDAKQPAVERTITGGVKVQDLTTGNGPEAKQGKRVSVYYTGRLKSNNKTFDSMQKGNGFKFALGGGEVIKGWDVGVAGMKVGGKRRLTCPAHMAYGARGHPPTIPPNSTLVFDVELKAVH